MNDTKTEKCNACDHQWLRIFRHMMNCRCGLYCSITEIQMRVWDTLLDAHRSGRHG